MLPPIKQRLAQLQSAMKTERLDGYVVPSSDAHQSEYVAAPWKRREFISGFTGSAGTFACTVDQAGLWTDGRYWNQGAQELQGTPVALYRSGAPQVPEWQDWMIQNLPKGARIGLNGRLFSIEQFSAIEKTLTQANLQLIDVQQDLVDLVWGKERPSLPSAPLRIHPDSFAGETVGQKLTRLRQAFTKEKVQGLLVSALDEIAWLLNLRGSDVEFNPVFYAYVWVGEHQTKVFTDLAKITPAIRSTYGSEIIWTPYEQWMDFLASLTTSQKIWVDPSTTNAAMDRTLQNRGVPTLNKQSPIAGWKAIKNPGELAGMVRSHNRDGLALVKFLRWLQEYSKAQDFKKDSERDLDEIYVGDKLEHFRKQSSDYIGPSFATIAGFGPNGALPHYRAIPATNLKLKSPGILLLDSGGQYVDGTTDVTRTIAIGEPLPLHTKTYTLVLKSHLQLGRSYFPDGTIGFQLDAIARQPLWQHGMTYGHGTGHGVGAALCVHEGPFSVSTRRNFHPIQEGSILSNEPACYFDGDFGVRIENLVSTSRKVQSIFGDFLGFDDLTVCPYDRRLIDLKLLNADEIAQVDRYHKKVLDTLAPELSGKDLEFLKQACLPLESE